MRPRRKNYKNTTSCSREGTRWANVSGIAFSAAVILAAICSPTQARSWLILPDGTGDAPTIQSGIDSAAAGDTVTLANGVFSGDGNRELNFNGKAITVRSMSGMPEDCVLDCGGMRGISFVSGEGNNSVLEGVGITNADDSHPGARGAAVLIDGAAPVIRNCRFFGNRTSIIGAGAYCRNSDGFVFEHCDFIANSSGTSGGAIGTESATGVFSDCVVYNSFAVGSSGILCSGSTIRFLRCNISGNHAFDSSAGGGAFINSEIEFLDCEFEGNSSFLYGGAVLLNNTTAIIQGCRFSENHGGLSIEHDGGGAIHVGGASSVTIEDSEFIGNTIRAFGTGVGGGAIQSADSRVVIRSCIFTENNVLYGGTGGAIAIGSNASFEIRGCLFDKSSSIKGGAIAVYQGEVLIDSCDFIGNHAEDSGGAIWANTFDMQLSHSVFLNNTAENTGGGLTYHEMWVLRLERCSFRGNDAPAGCQIFMEEGMGYLDNCILSFGTGGGRPLATPRRSD